jgi:hypothetical protein
MSGKSLLIAVPLAVCLVAHAAFAPLAAADPIGISSSISFETSQSPFTPGSVNQGWWSDTWPNEDLNDNYLTGIASFGPHFRSFFTFDLSGLDLTGQKILSASLELSGFGYSSSDSSETIGFFDVSTPAAILNHNVGTSAEIFNDLGSGVSYGSFIVPAYAFDATLLFELNAAALTSIAKAAGGFFSIGGALLTAEVGQYLFASSGGTGIQRLTLVTAPAEPIPEPTTILLLGGGLLGAAGARRWVRR